ncbi:MAG: pyridoxal phosphate-dependent aminotransferase [Agathobacter sp.]|nr:pyridoxal phosphate-dependent aminotransferase [Agathobacter sp.]
MNRDIERIKDSASVELMIKARELKEAGVDIIGLAGGEPDFDTPEPIKEKAISELLKGNTHYAVGKGILPLRQKIAQKLHKDNGIAVSADEIIVTPGAKMAIYLAVRACINEGDEVLIPTPSWVSYTEIVRASSGVPVEVPLNPEDNYTITAEVLEKYVTSKTKMLILCSPNNPTGRMISEKEIQEIIRFVKGKDIIILSDEIYEKISYVRNSISLASCQELKDCTLTVNGFSKAYAMTGWRLGYIAGSSKYINTMNRLFTHTITGTPPFVQTAAVVALDCDDEVKIMQKEYKRRRDFFLNALNEIPEVQAIVPEGAFYAWCHFNIQGDIAQKLLENTGVIGVPGRAYGSGYDQYIRFSFANDMKDLEEAVRRIKEYVLNGYKEEHYDLKGIVERSLR